MRRAITVLAGTAVFAVALGTPGSANDPVGEVVAAAEQATGVQVGPLPNTVVGGGRARSAVVGAIVITSTAATTGAQPSYGLIGALADPTQWSCAGGGSTALYRVTCVPQPLPVTVVYHCDVLHADALAPFAGSSVRSTMDCDSDGQAEAQTNVVTGPAGWDTELAVDMRAVTAFTCIADHGAGDWTARCGDPGLVGVE